MWLALDELVTMPSALSTFLKYVDWRERRFRDETYRLLMPYVPGGRARAAVV